MTPIELMGGAIAASIALCILSIGVAVMSWAIRFGWRKGKD